MIKSVGKIIVVNAMILSLLISPVQEVFAEDTILEEGTEEVVENTEETVENAEEVVANTEEELTVEGEISTESPIVEEGDTIEVSPLVSVRSAADSVTVATEAELISELGDINTISGTLKTIDITADIQLTQEITINTAQGKDIEIISSTGATLTSAVGRRHFNVVAGTQALTIRDLTLVGNIEATYIDGENLIGAFQNASQGGGIIGRVGGMFTVDNVTFKFIKEKALDVEANGGALIQNSSFIANTSNIEGIAIRPRGVGATWIIENSTFRNNRGHRGTAINYMNPVVFLGNVNTNLIVRNNIFLDNHTLVAGTTAAATGGGAIGIKQAQGTVHIDDNYFEGNEVEAAIGSGIGNGTTADGGAIYAWWSTGEIHIFGNTFYKNTANDEGGAISIVASAHPANFIANNTFVENHSRGQQVSSSWGIGNDGDDGGGAIEINGDSSTRGYARVANNTFYNNVAEPGLSMFGSSANQGGGISFRYANGLFTNNILVGNTAVVASTNDVYIDRGTTNVTLTENIYNEVVSSVYYNESPMLGIYNNTVLAGNPSDGTQQIIPVLQPIAPNNGSSALGLADGTAIDAVDVDQRNYARNSLADMGSIEIVFVEFNANGGLWIKGPEEVFYDGVLFYAAEENGATREQLLVTYPTGEVTEVSELPIHEEGMEMVGWNTDPNATEGLSEEELMDVLTNVTENRILYAIWVRVEDDTIYTVNFYNCDGKIIAQDWVGPGENATAPSGYAYELATYTNVMINRDAYPLNCAGEFQIPNTGR